MAVRKKVRKTIFLFDGDYEILQEHYDGTRVCAAEVIRLTVRKIAENLTNQPLADSASIPSIAAKINLED